MGDILIAVAAGEHKKLVLDRRASDQSRSLYRIELAENARLDLFVVLGGQPSTTFTCDLVLVGRGSCAVVKGLYHVKGKQNVEIFVRQIHQAARARSDVLIKGILADEAKALFEGTIVVGAKAQGTHATLYNKNLVLSERARAVSKPRLEVLADAVHCKHGSAVGTLDPEHLFCLGMRGVPDDTARSLLIDAFAAEVVDGFVGIE